MGFLARLLVGLSWAVGCVPEVDVDESVVSTPRVVAVRATPAESPPGQEAEWEALWVGGEGEVSWSFCGLRAPLSQSGAVSARCLAGEEGALTPIGVGGRVRGALPQDACARFGPDLPPTQPGEAAGRPADPDVTGGYRQPMVLQTLDGPVSFEQRVRCGLAGASQAESAFFRRAYVDNANPSLASLQVLREGEVLADTASGDRSAVVRPGEALSLVARWSPCPSARVCGDRLCALGDGEACPPDEATACEPLVGCAGAESYLYFEPEVRRFEVRRESLRLSWLATSPGLALERTGAREQDAGSALESRNTFLAPQEPQEVQLWVVLRDARGGAGWSSLLLRVEP